jgi:hypothetical protein
MSDYQIFSSPTLLSHLAKQLHQRWCTIAEKNNMYFFTSSDIDCLRSSNRKKSKKKFDGLLSVINLPSPNSQIPTDNEMICVHRLLTILNGIIRFKYRDGNGLRRYLTTPTNPVTVGVTKRELGIEVTRSVPVRFHLAYPVKYYQDAEKQPPNLRNIWRVARRDPSVARLFYYYGLPVDARNLRKTIEEIAADTFLKKSVKTELNITNWIRIQKWTEPEVPSSKMLDIWHYINNSYLSGDEAMHALGASSKQQVNAFNVPLTLLDAIAVIHILIMKWIRIKVN